MKNYLSILLGLLLMAVGAQAQKISVTPTNLMMEVGDQETVSCTYSGNSSLVWTSSNTAVAKVVGNGKTATIYAEGSGTAKITVQTSSMGGGGYNQSASLSVAVEGASLTEKDLPFIPATRKGSSLGSDTHWYLLTLRGGRELGKFVYLNGYGISCVQGEPYYDGEKSMTNFLWAVTGDLDGGFQLYNYDLGGAYCMGTEAGEMYWGSYEGAYMKMYPIGELADEQCTFRASAYNDGIIFTLLEEAYAGINDYNNSGDLCIWDDYRNLNDDGACFRFYEVDPLDYGGEPSGVIVNETAVRLDVQTLELAAGESHQFVATLTPENASYKHVTWSSSNPAVASVSATGLVEARGTGTTTITATTHGGLTASATVTVTLNTDTQGLVINEVQAANVDQYMDPSYNYGGWIELYNGSNAAMQLSGLFLTDNLDNMVQWPLASLNKTYANYQRGSTRYTPYCSTSAIVPAKGYSLVWFDHNDWRYPMMCPFKLDCDGGSLYVTDGSKVIAQCDYPESISRVSWARTRDGGEQWGWASVPTPGQSNAGGIFATERLEAPVVDTDSRVFASGDFTVRISWPEEATLRYTTDGSTPTATHGQTSASGIFPISTTTLLRLCAVQDGKMTSPVVTRSYIQTKNEISLPVLSVVTEQGNLTDSQYGIMVNGTNGRPGLGRSTTSNLTQDWDRPANVEFIINEDEMVFNQEANIAICGGWSRFNTPHSFKIKGKKHLEHINYLPYPFFSAKPYIKNKTLQMRNGGNHTNEGRFEDAAIQTVILSSGLNVDGQAYEPVHVFENGQYAGLMNIREPNNRDMVYSNYGYDDDEVDQFEMDCDSGYVQSCGDRDAFEVWYDLASRLKTEPELYDQIREICDVEEFINYMAVQCYLALGDYGYNNVKGYRPRVDHGKFRFVLYDLDSYSTSSSGSKFSWSPTSYSHNAQYEGTDGAKGAARTSIEVEYQTIFNNMLSGSDEFRKQFVDQFSILCGSVLEPERCHHIVDSLSSRILSAASLEGLYPSYVGSQINSSVFNATRLSNALAAMASNSRYSAACRGNNQTLTLSQSNGRGRVLYNDLTIPTGRFSGRIFSPVTLRAEAPAGYKFLGWKDTSGNTHTGTTTGQEKKVFDFGSDWYYYDQGSLDEESWTAKGYTGDLSWPEGGSPLGYNTKDGSEFRTTLDYGGITSYKYPTYYFRKYFNLSSIPQSVKLLCHIDDGAAVYLNGREVVRHNLPEGAKYDDYALSYTNNAYYDLQYDLDPNDFVVGNNTLAVEVHNNGPSSSDIYWDAALTCVEKSSKPDPDPDPKEDYYSTDVLLELPAEGNFSLEAVYGLMTAEESSLSDNHPVKVNEVSAANSIYINDQFKKDDWVELYNTTSEDIDLTGYYLSDNLAKPTKYQIEASSVEGGNIIPAHGHRVIWCATKRTRSGRDIYAPFKLDNADGCCVLLTAPDQSWCDTLTYLAMNGDETCGLYPDGSSRVYLMQMPTIDQANRLTMYADLYDEHAIEPEPVPLGLRQISHSNELGITALSDRLLVTNEYGLATTLCIYDASGRTVLRQQLDMAKGRAVVSTASLPAGTYVARATDTDDESVSTKFAR